MRRFFFEYMSQKTWFYVGLRVQRENVVLDKAFCVLAAAALRTVRSFFRGALNS